MEEKSKAIQEVAKTTGKVVEVTKDFGAFLREVFGTVPEDTVGLLIGDWLRVKRLENMANMAAKARDRLRARGVKHAQEVSPSIAIPLLRYSADENREELQDVWSRLMAAAMDPRTAGSVRQSFIEAVKRMDPLDARVLAIVAAPPTGGTHTLDRVTTKVGATQDQVFVSLKNLTDIGCLEDRPNFSNIALNAMGRELMRVLSD